MNVREVYMYTTTSLKDPDVNKNRKYKIEYPTSKKIHVYTDMRGRVIQVLRICLFVSVIHLPILETCITYGYL